MLRRAIAKSVATAEPMTWAEAFLLSTLIAVTSVPVVAGLYLVKSAAGINLMTGHSPLHDLLYHFVA